VVDAFPAVGMKLGEPGTQSGWPRQLTYLDLAWLSRETGYNLLPYLVYQTSKSPDGLIRDWQQNFQSGQRMTPDKHRGYALQWYSLVVLTIIMYFVLSLKRTTTRQDNEQQYDKDQ
jgi:cytochrome oxidase assembly protein ShyY1